MDQRSAILSVNMLGTSIFHFFVVVFAVSMGKWVCIVMVYGFIYLTLVFDGVCVLAGNRRY